MNKKLGGFAACLMFLASSLSFLNGQQRSLSVPNEAETIDFTVGPFRIHGELRKPLGEGRRPAVIMVHGDGRAFIAQRGVYYPIMDRILKAGYACYSWDKPGFGKSTGQFDNARLRRQRADILLGAVKVLQSHSSIAPDRVGVWGISQAGYVIPYALQKPNAIAFMIGVSCGGEDGVGQNAFLVGSQLLHAGFSAQEVEDVRALFKACMLAQTYDEYVKSLEAYNAHPVNRKLKRSETPRRHWTPFDLSSEARFNPMTVIEKTRIPILAFFGERDTQVDPAQGAKAYSQALHKAGNPHSKVVTIPGVDHDLIFSETGSIEERNKRNLAQWQDYSPLYLDTLEAWLKGLPWPEK